MSLADSKATPPPFNGTFNSTPSNPWDSPADHTGLLNVVGWYLVVLYTLIMLVRLITRWVLVRQVTSDDILITLAWVFGVLAQITISLGVESGLGLTDVTADMPGIVAVQKSIYAMNALILVSLSFTRCSVSILLRDLTAIPNYRRASLAILGSAVVTSVIAVVCVLFQCAPPQTWNSIGNSCMNRGSMYTYVGVAGMLVDGALIVLPFLMVAKLQLTTKKKMVVIACFASRILVILGAISQLILMSKVRGRYFSPFMAPAVVLATQATACCGIVTACIPYLKPFLDSLSHGMLRSDDLRRRRGFSTMPGGYGRKTGRPTGEEEEESEDPRRRSGKLRAPSNMFSATDMSKYPGLHSMHGQITTIKGGRRPDDDPQDRWEAAATKEEGPEGAPPPPPEHGGIRTTTTWTVTSD